MKGGTQIMKKNKFFIGLAVALCVLSFAGCGTSDKISDDTNNAYNTSNPTNANDSNAPVDESNDSLADNQPEGDDGDSLIDLSAIQGSVVEFSDGACTITPVETSDDGETAVAAAPGSENTDNNVTVHYQDDCIFQIAQISQATGKASISDADISDIKKQTSLILYGEWSDTYNLNATRVIIARYE